jgi:hypothetical protein
MSLTEIEKASNYSVGRDLRMDQTSEESRFAGIAHVLFISFICKQNIGEKGASVKQTSNELTSTKGNLLQQNLYRMCQSIERNLQCVSGI